MTLSKKQLSRPRQRLLELMQELNFGFIRNLQVLRGEPQIVTSLQLIEDVKLDGQRVPRSELNLADFVLKDQHIEFFNELNRIGTGTVAELAVRHGLPCRLMVSRQIS